MIAKARISAAAAGGWRVVIGGRVSAPFPLMLNFKPNEYTELPELSPGDLVVVALFGENLADGAILGKVENV